MLDFGTFFATYLVSLREYGVRRNEKGSKRPPRRLPSEKKLSGAISVAPKTPGRLDFAFRGGPSRGGARRRRCDFGPKPCSRAGGGRIPEHAVSHLPLRELRSQETFPSGTEGNFDLTRRRCAETRAADHRRFALLAARVGIRGLRRVQCSLGFSWDPPAPRGILKIMALLQ